MSSDELAGELFTLFRGDRFKAFRKFANGINISVIALEVSKDTSTVNSWIDEWRDQGLITNGGPENIFKTYSTSPNYSNLTNKGRRVKNLLDSIDRQIENSEISESDIQVREATIDLGGIMLDSEDYELLDDVFEDVSDFI